MNEESNINLAPVGENVSEFKRRYDGRGVRILGVDYTIRVVPADDYHLTSIEANGTCEAYSKELFVKDFTMETDPKQYKNIEEYCKKILRHEIVHSVFFESGCMKYFEDEELTETLAHLVPKMAVIMESLNLM